MANSVASTAFGPMVIVAIEQTLPESKRIVQDSVAYQMLPLYMKGMAASCNISFVRNGFLNLLEQATPGIYTGMVCRKRYVEDKLMEALQGGLDAVVILGAGLDTLAYRIPQLNSLKVYEIDMPENIDYKRKQLQSRFGGIPPHVTLIPIDFETQPLESVLHEAGYSFDQRTFFVWEGVTQYLTDQAMAATFQFLAKAKTGSRMVFTYVLKDFLEGKNMYGAKSLYERFVVKEGVWLFGFDPGTLPDFVGRYGWKVLEDVGTSEFTARYLTPTDRTGAIAEIERAVCVEKL